MSDKCQVVQKEATTAEGIKKGFKLQKEPNILLLFPCASNM